MHCTRIVQDPRRAPPALAASLFLALAASPRAAPQEREDELAAAIAGIGQEALRSGARELVVVVDVGGELLFSRGFGRDARGESPGGDTRIHAGPFLSSFLAALALALEEEGRLDRRASLAEHFPELPYGSLGVFVDQLSTHTSGIPGYGELLRGGRRSTERVEPERVLAWLRNGPLDAQPGSCALYSETDDLLLGLVLEAVTRKNVRAQLEALFARTAMEDSGFGCAPPSRSPLVEQEFAGAFEDRAGTPAPFDAGELCTTAHDLVRFQRALVERRVLGADALALRATLARLADGGRVAWGRGVTLAGDGRRTRQSCGGTLGGQRAQLAYLPELDATLAVWGDDGTNVPRIVEQVARALLDEEEPEPRDVPLSAEERARYVGEYFVGCISYSVADEEEHLVLYPPEGGRAVLACQGGDGFVARDDPDVRLEFERDGEAVVAFVIHSHGVSERARRMY